MATLGRFRAKGPAVIEAEQWVVTNWNPDEPSDKYTLITEQVVPNVAITATAMTSDGPVNLEPNDWVVRSPQGIVVMKDAAFRHYYEPA